MTETSRTGEGLGDLFADRHEQWAADLRADTWLSPPRRALGAIASATVAMHVREGIAVGGLSAGMVTAGTASADEAWAGELVAARGFLRLLDSGRIAEDGVRRPFAPAGDSGLTELRAAFADTLITAVGAHPSADTLVTAVGAQAFANTLIVAAPAGAEDPAPESELEQMARTMTDVPGAVVVERPVVPELTEEPLENVRRLFALTVSQLADLFGVTERQAHRYLRDGLPESRRQLAAALTAVGLTVIGGLGADGARRWLFSGTPTAAELAKQGRIAELAERAEALRDSPVT